MLTCAGANRLGKLTFVQQRPPAWLVGCAAWVASLAIELHAAAIRPPLSHCDHWIERDFLGRCCYCKDGLFLSQRLSDDRHD